MQLTQQQALALASLISDCYQPPEVNKVAVQPPPRRRQVPVKAKVKRPQTRTEMVDAGVQPVVNAITAVGVVLAIGLGVTFGGGVLVIALFAVVGSDRILRRSLRRRTPKTITEEVEVEETEMREVTEEGAVQYRDISVPNPMRTTAMGRVVLRFLALPVRGGTLLIDPYGLVAATPVTLPEVEDAEALHAHLTRLDEITRHVEYVLHGEGVSFPLTRPTTAGDTVVLRGQERELYEGYREVSAALACVREVPFTLHAVPPGDPLRERLRPSASHGTTTTAALEARRLLEALLAPEGDALDARLRAGAKRWQVTQSALDAARRSALRGGISPHCRNMGIVFHYSAFNFYCPACNATLQQELLARDYTLQGDESHAPVQYSRNTKCQYDPDRDRWRCPTCELVSAHPIPIHRTLDDVLFPAYDRLMEENKNARLAVYADARAKEMQYQNAMETEVEQLFQRNREALETLRYDLQRCVAEVDGENAAIESFRGVMRSHQVTQSEALKRTLAEHAAVLAKVERDREVTGSRIDEVFTREREIMVRVMTECSRAQAIETERRDAIQRRIAASNERIVTNTTVMVTQNAVMVNQGDTMIEQGDRMTHLQGRLVDETEHHSAMYAASLMSAGYTAADVHAARDKGSLR